jgi:hypothetical protein
MISPTERSPVKNKGAVIKQQSVIQYQVTKHSQWTEKLRS